MSAHWSDDRVRVLILHAYSPKNSGDGLLVELAKNICRDALGDAQFKVIASEADAFGGSEYVQWRSLLPATASPIVRRLNMAMTGVLGPHSSIRRLAESADVIVGVGGGYLRGRSAIESFKSWGAHVGQVKLAGRFGERVVYLPQSIGPLSGSYNRVLEKHLSKMSAVCLRDDRSVKELGGVEPAIRVPDMAVLELARHNRTPSAIDISRRPLFIARDLRRPRGYSRLLEAAKEIDLFEFVLQSQGGGNNDLPLTLRLNGAAPRTTREALDEGRPRVVVSTRLHGALSSLIAGYPAVHLSYERKGWGAYEDLGLDDFVLNAREATLDQVLNLVQRIEGDPEAFWSRVEQRRDRISKRYGELRETISRVTSRDLRSR